MPRMSNPPTTMIQIKREGTWWGLPAPSDDSGTYEIETLVDSGRNAAGFMVGKVIGSDKIKLNLKWRSMNADEFNELLRFFDPNYGGSFINTVRFYDPRADGMVEKQMYVGNRSGQPFMMRETFANNWRPDGFIDVQANLIEV